MHARERLRAERVLHDRQARERSLTFARQPERLAFGDDEYLDHESWIRPALARLGDVGGRRVLDLGCGHGMMAIVLARRGARVLACDLSPGYLDEARLRARANGVELLLACAEGERLPFADASFDLIWGNAVLHHLDLECAGPELRRVLVPGGRAVCCEPWGENPALRWARRRLPYPGKDRTPDEEPLRRRHIVRLRQWFERVEVEGHQLFAMAQRFIRRTSRIASGLDWCDALLLRRVPALRNWCRYVVIQLDRDGGGTGR
jgi:SAM-dependent methyltransferase